ncbi:MAG TPA: patatin-like phospholipase family protein, partial [Acidimicrobiia bacterium]|nr:patatin-like phospholipase family protein [Acidimicrobiia bacterium]
HRFDPVRALMTHMRDGNRTLTQHVEFLGSGWPERDLYVTACRRRDGHRTVFGSSFVPDDGLQAAVAASCAVPGYFAPVVVDGASYIDGGIASPTNADVLRDCGLDLLVVLSPMSTTARLPRYSPERIVRDRAGHRLHRELRIYERLGVPAIVFEPGTEVLEHVTADFMSEEHVNDIVRASFLETGARLCAPELRAALGSLTARVAA